MLYSVFASRSYGSGSLQYRGVIEAVSEEAAGKTLGLRKVEGSNFFVSDADRSTFFTFAPTNMLAKPDDLLARKAPEPPTVAGEGIPDWKAGELFTGKKPGSEPPVAEARPNEDLTALYGKLSRLEEQLASLLPDGEHRDAAWRNTIIWARKARDEDRAKQLALQWELTLRVAGEPIPKDKLEQIKAALESPLD